MFRWLYQGVVWIYVQFDTVVDLGLDIFNPTHLVLLLCPSEKDMDFLTVPLAFGVMREVALEVEERRIGVG